ncbi:hypothetical protein AVEN_5339-1 [Araneus ventricosus]|uniref:Uncharacterized protein n=1 Tax=Araneus ventricosus TaxID=182803 RepID=A0A4Y2V8C6_ARAVE|nr:hypothetical protein AVEN_5339-1 [Araneus ventricosus]
MSCYFGLYFGNTNMCLAMHKDSKTEVLANAAGYRVTPSVIAYLGESEKSTVPTYFVPLRIANSLPPRMERRGYLFWLRNDDFNE